MPQLIAMVIVVVGAMIYMFQTFGGTGDKIEGIAQKTSVITEINNIRTGLKLAAKTGHIENVVNTATVPAKNLEGLAELSYFPAQINEQLDVDGQIDTKNEYSAISFGGEDAAGNHNMVISLVSNIAGAIPGIYVDLSRGNLRSNAAFLEAQIASDLGALASIDRHAVSATANALPENATGILARTPTDTGASANSESDGKFIIYYKDFASDEVVVAGTAPTPPAE